MNPFAHTSQRVAVLIDAQNIYHSAKNFYRRQVDFRRLVDLVLGERNLVRALAYVVKSDLTPKEVSFFEALEHRGIQLRVKELIVFGSGVKKADWDVGLAVDAIRIASAVDTIVLVSGDGDFVPLLDYLRNQGKQVEVAAFGKNASSKLREGADYFYDLDEFAKLILIGSSSHR